MVPVRFNPNTMTFIGIDRTEGRVSTRRGLGLDWAMLAGSWSLWVVQAMTDFRIVLENRRLEEEGKVMEWSPDRLLRPFATKSGPGIHDRSRGSNPVESETKSAQER